MLKEIPKDHQVPILSFLRKSLLFLLLLDLPIFSHYLIDSSLFLKKKHSICLVLCYPEGAQPNIATSSHFR